MKIIFDSEEQKNKFMGFLIMNRCPADFDLEERCSPYTWHCRGEECWKEAGVELEVMNNENNI